MFVWGTKKNQLSVNNIKLKQALCPKCQIPTNINLNYLAEATHVYWISGKGSIKEVHMICLNCGETFNLKGELLLFALQYYQNMVKGKENEYPNVNGLYEKTQKYIEDKNKKN